MHQVIGSARHARLQLLRDQSGLSTIEYVVILVLIAGIAVGTWTFFGGQVRCALGLANDQVATAIDSGTGSTGSQTCAKGNSSASGTPSPGDANADPATRKIKHSPNSTN